MTDRALSPADYRSLAAFRHALRAFLRFSEEAAGAAGIPPAQHQLLLAVKGWPGDEAPTISEAAEYLHLKPHSAVELVQRAVAGGFLSTERDQRDARRQRLAVTPAGNDVLASLSAIHRQELRRFRREMNAVLSALD